MDSNGNLVAIVHQGVTSAQNQGFAIPESLVRTFLIQCIQHNKYLGTLGWPFLTDPLENKTLRQSCELNENIQEGGVLVKKVAPLFYKKNSEDSVQAGDVLLAITDEYGCEYPINYKGEVSHFSGVPDFLYCSVVAQQSPIDNTIRLKLKRAGEVRIVEISLATPIDYYWRVKRVPRSAPPINFIYAHGVVFVEGTYAKLLAHGSRTGNTVGPTLYPALSTASFSDESRSSVVYAYIRNPNESGYSSEPFIVSFLNQRKIRHMGDVRHALNLFNESDGAILAIRTAASDTDDIFVTRLTPEQEEKARRRYQIIAQTNRVSTKPVWRRALGKITAARVIAGGFWSNDGGSREGDLTSGNAENLDRERKLNP